MKSDGPANCGKSIDQTGEAETMGRMKALAPETIQEEADEEWCEKWA